MDEGARKHVGHRDTCSYNTSLKDPAMGYNTAIVKGGVQSEDVGEGGEGAKKDVGYRVLPNLKKLFIKIQYTN